MKGESFGSSLFWFKPIYNSSVNPTLIDVKSQKTSTNLRLTF